MSLPAVITRKLVASSDVAREAWKTVPSSYGVEPNVPLAVYIPQNPNSPIELYTTITDGKGETVFYFAKSRQIYAVVSFKCVKKRGTNGMVYYEIVPSAEDIEMGRSPLRPIGCKVNEKDPVATSVRIFVVDTVEPTVSKAFISTK